jgi:hypothetical protein
MQLGNPTLTDLINPMIWNNSIRELTLVNFYILIEISVEEEYGNMYEDSTCVVYNGKLEIDDTE